MVRLLCKLEESSYKVSAGIGGICDSFNKLHVSFRQALQALEVGYRLYGKNKILSTEELGLEKFIDLVGKEFRQSFYYETLAYLRTDEGNYDYQLIKTALAFLDSGLKSGEASRKLFIHRNTLTYRIERIKLLTGLDLRVVDDALKFKLALMCLNYDRSLM
jgi:carbohydrate diacid regulator